MIRAAFVSEWVKLRRLPLLLGTYLGLAAAAALFTGLMFGEAAAPGHRGGFITLRQLAQPDGLVHGLSRAAVLLGIVAFGIAASQIASEYSLGTLRQVLIRQPRRAIFLLGKHLAVVAFLVGAVLLATAASATTAVAMAHVRNISSSAWTSSTGLADNFRALGDMTLAVIGFATFGTFAGVLLRSSVAAIILGLAYVLPVENIIGSLVHSLGAWLPGQLLLSVAQGGNASIRFANGMIGSLIYLAAALGAAVALFVRRDVTA
jgi:ABC-type transport system involved in multi-copper enzyme maturation permease subunit